jgi:hypothetical protein
VLERRTKRPSVTTSIGTSTPRPAVAGPNGLRLKP